MNPHATIFKPSSVPHKSNASRVSLTAHHHSNGHHSSQRSHHKHGQMLPNTITATNVRINQNILSNTTAHTHQHIHSDTSSTKHAAHLQQQQQQQQQNQAIAFPLSPLFHQQNIFQMQHSTIAAAATATSPTDAQLSPTDTNAAANAALIQNTLVAEMQQQHQLLQLENLQNLSVLQNQQIIYAQMQQLTEKGQQISVRMNSVLQPQLTELSEQMQTALFNCNHVTQPEYYAGLQNQHLILTQSLKEAQHQYTAVSYQYHYYQQLLLQQQQLLSQQQQQQQVVMDNAKNVNVVVSNHHHNKDTTLLNGYKQQLQQAYDDNSNLYGSYNVVTKYNETAPEINTTNKLMSANHLKKKHSTKQDIFERRLCVLITKLTPERFDKVLAKMLEFLDHHVSTQNELKTIVDKILRFTLNQAYLASLTAKLFLHFYDYLPRLIMTQQYQQHLWDTNDVDISLTFRKILITALEKLFEEFRGGLEQVIEEEKKEVERKEKEEENKKSTIIHELNPEKLRLKTDFIALMEIIGELYNMDLVHIRVLRKGIFDRLLPSKSPPRDTLTAFCVDIIDIEAISVIFRSCGKKLDTKHSRFVDKYINKLDTFGTKLSTKYDRDEAKKMVSETRATRSNNWVIHKITHNQKYRSAKIFQIPLDEIREEVITNEDEWESETNGAALYSSNSSSPKPFRNSNEFAKGFQSVTGANALYSLTKCYGFNEDANGLKVIKNINAMGFIKCMEFGYNGSSYVLGDEGRLMVSGRNTFGELGIENEIVHQIVRNWDKSHLIHRCKDISYLITSYVDFLRYKCDFVRIQNAKYIMNDIVDEGRLVSSGISSRHRFVLTSCDQLYGAGCNTFNQLGYDKNDSDPHNLYRGLVNNNGHNFDEMDAMPTKNHWVKINFFSDKNIKLRNIQCGFSTSTFLSEEGTVYTVGYSSFGNLGIGDKKNKLAKITRIYTIKTKILSISCGFDHTLAINEYRYVLSYGDNNFGQLGHGHTIQNRRQKPKEIEYFHKHNIHAIEISCGAFHSVVLDCNGLIYCFGYNLGYQCHENNDDGELNISTPKMNATLHNIDKAINIKCGAFHNIVETQQNQWYLWGDNRNKQCLVYENKAQFIKTPTKYHQKDIPKHESIVDMFPGYDQTIVFTTKLTI